jgi:hypothetical protein
VGVARGHLCDRVDEAAARDMICLVVVNAFWAAFGAHILQEPPFDFREEVVAGRYEAVEIVELLGDDGVQIL